MARRSAGDIEGNCISQYGELVHGVGEGQVRSDAEGKRLSVGASASMVKCTSRHI